jgi:hypothetical protein
MGGAPAGAAPGSAAARAAAGGVTSLQLGLPQRGLERGGAAGRRQRAGADRAGVRRHAAQRRRCGAPPRTPRRVRLRDGLLALQLRRRGRAEGAHRRQHITAAPRRGRQQAAGCDLAPATCARRVCCVLGGRRAGLCAPPVLTCRDDGASSGHRVPVCMPDDHAVYSINTLSACVACTHARTNACTHARCGSAGAGGAWGAPRAHRGLGRAPRQRHAAHVRGRPHGAVLLGAPP